jgi:hypothetical protein
MDDIQKLKRQTLATLIGLALIIGGGCFAIQRYNNGGFSGSQLKHYESLYQQLDPASKDKALRPWSKGDVLILKPTSENPTGSGPLIHEQHWELPENVRATPGKVATLVFTTSTRVKVGSYTNGAGAFREDVHLTILDAETGEFMGDEFVWGANPPGAILKTQFVSATGEANIKNAVVALPGVKGRRKK